jgi:hydrogenase expression/formation protein HypC
MCLAVPGEVKKIDGEWAECTIGGTTFRARCDLVPDIELGDYAIIHAGFVIQRLDEEEARETLSLLDQIAADASAGEA